MPTITLVRDALFSSIGRNYTDKEFDALCFEFGVEVDDISTESVEYTGDGTKDDNVVCYKIDIPANRYDLLCLEGFSRAIRIFLSLENPPIYKILEPATGRLTMTVETSTSQIRPYVVCAVLRNLKFDRMRYKSFIDLQEKLHQNVCRKRTYVAIGTHDLDTLQPPFRYQALAPNEINFVPLTENEGRSYGGKELLDFYREDPSVKHLKPYTDIIYDSTVYPVIYDSANTVLSLPPIINGKHSRIQMHTTNVFIECTATDLTKANIVLDTIITMFSEYCQQPFTVEPVNVVYQSTNKQTTTPSLSCRSCDASIKDICGTIGVELDAKRICELCDRMQLGPAEYLPQEQPERGGIVRVQVPPTRSDVLHAVDVIEDVAIAYGYNNIPLVVPNTTCFGAPLPINQFSDLIRAEVARAGYMEMLTHGLCSTAENFTHLRRPIGPAVSLANPANIEYEVVRTTLIPGALKTLAFNNSMSHKDGIKLFEISDIVVPDTANGNEIGAKNCRRLVALYSSHTAGFGVIHGLADRILTSVQIVPEAKLATNSLIPEEYGDIQRVGRQGVVYSVRTSSDPLFFPGMGAELVLHYHKVNDEGNEAGVDSESDVVKEVVVGWLGVVHPQTLQNFEITYPCSVLEIDIDALM